MSKKILVVLLAAAMAVSLTACSQQPAEENSSSSVTQEEYDALKEQNEQLQAELDELKGETDGEAEGEPEEDAESGTSSDTSAANGETTSGTGAGTGTGTAAQGNTQAAAGNTAQTGSQASAPSSTTSTPTTQKTNTSSGKGPLAKYTVNVQDSTTPAVKVTGTTLNGKSAYYFYSADGKLLGDIPTQYLGTIINENGLSYAEADEQKAWFVENFNIYRGLDGGSSSGSSSSGSSSSSSGEVDIEDLRQEVFDLVNEERVANGMPECVMDDTAMEFAQIRAEEIVDKFSHTRPDGTVMTYSHYNFAENIAMGQDTPKDVVNAWMNSSGHRAAILGDYSDYGNCMGVGVYKANGKLHWVLEFIGWDANA